MDEGSASIATEILGHPRRQILLYRHRIIYAHSPATCRSGRSWPWWWLARALAAPCPFLLRSSAPFLISQESGFRDHARALSLHRDRRIYGCACRSESLHHWRLSEFSSFVDLSSIKKLRTSEGTSPARFFQIKTQHQGIAYSREVRLQIARLAVSLRGRQAQLANQTEYFLAASAVNHQPSRSLSWWRAGGDDRWTGRPDPLFLDVSARRVRSACGAPTGLLYGLVGKRTFSLCCTCLK